MNALVLTVLLGVGAAAGGGEVPPPGRWVGDLRLGSSVVTVLVEASLSGPAAVSVSVLPFGPFDAPAAVAGDRDEPRLELELGGGRLELSGPAGETWWRGAIAGPGGSSGEFELRALGPEPEPEPLEGVYAGASGTVLVTRFSELGRGLFLVDLETGELGPLYPLAPGELFWGASVASPALPARAAVRLSAGGSRLELLRPGAPPLGFARRPLERRALRFASGEIELAGTLTRAAGEGSAAAMVLLHGSGPADRHQLGPWVHLFAARGAAVLVYDKRGTGSSGGDWQSSGLEGLAADAVAAVRHLQTLDGVDRRRIGVMGLSQGGWLVPQVAAAVPEVAFAAVHAGAAVTPAEQGLRAIEAELAAYGFDAAEIERALAYYRLSDEVTRGRRPLAEQQRLFEEAREAPWLLGPPDAEDSAFRNLYRRLLDFDPLPYWRRVRCPVLAVFGERDLVVPAEPSAGLLRAALPDPAQLEIELVPRANHLMLRAGSGLRDEVPSLTGFEPRYLDILGRWLDRRLAAGSEPDG